MGIGTGHFKTYADSAIRPEPAKIIELAPTPSFDKEQYIPLSHRLSGLKEAWGGGYRGMTNLWKCAVPCFVLDTGGSPGHPDLKGAYGSWVRAKLVKSVGSSTRRLLTGGRDCTQDRWEKRCFYGHRWNAKNWADTGEHGTHVAGIIGARDNEIGIVGVAPECDLWAMRVFVKRKVMACLDAWLIRAIDEAIRIAKTFYEPFGVQGGVINMSLGSKAPLSAGVQAAMQRAVKAGFIIVAAAGNDGDAVNWPAAWPEAIAVGALSRAAYKKKLKPSEYTSHGEEIDAAAIGDAVWSTIPGGWYAAFWGTSQATPCIAGEACRAKGRYPRRAYNTYAFRTDLADHSDPVDTDFLDETGWRLPRSVDLAKVLDKVRKDKEVRVIRGRDVELVVA